MLVSNHVAVLAPVAGKFLSVSGGVNRLLPKPALFWRAACQGRSLTNGLLLALAKRGEPVTALVFAPLLGSGPIKSQAIGFLNYAYHRADLFIHRITLPFRKCHSTTFGWFTRFKYNLRTYVTETTSRCIFSNLFGTRGVGGRANDSKYCVVWGHGTRFSNRRGSCGCA